MGSKGETFLNDAKKAGWDGKVYKKGSQEICEVEFKDLEFGATQKLVMVWDGAKYNDKESHRIAYTGDRRAIRNASAARDMLAAASGVQVKPDPKPKTAADDFETPDKPPVRPEAKPLPFTLSQPDARILEAVLGKEIYWWSEQRREVQSARVMSDPRQRHLKIITARGRRTLHWAASGEGFRAVHLDKIIEVRD